MSHRQIAATHSWDRPDRLDATTHRVEPVHFAFWVGQVRVRWKLWNEREGVGPRCPW